MDSTSDSPRKRIGLALGGGVARGLAHIGVLHVLTESGIQIDYVTGSSAGSIIGASFCAGKSVEEIYAVAMRLRWWQIARPVWPSRGLVSFAGLETWLVRNLGDIQFTDLKIPFAVVATDLDSGEPVTLNKGRLASAVRASCSVPGFVAPVEIEGRLLGDGSLADSVPVEILRTMGADIVVGVDLFKTSKRPGWGAIGMGLNALEILVQRAGGGIDDADVLISPQLAGESYLRFSRRERYFRQGEQAARKALGTIQAKLSESLVYPKRPLQMETGS